ncbi:MAG: calcium/sodium antiporter [Hyphomicrobiales bacterium]|nr:calcium/sodium antiporter [Hyphomicrobiales bacterium]
MSYLALVGGIALLLFCGDLLVRGAVGLAERLGIPAIIIGLTVVAFGTSAPELVVSLKAALANSPGIAIGNVVGSNIANVLVVLGLPALIATTDCDQTDIVRNSVYVLLASILFIALCFLGPLTVWHGIILLAAMALFLVDTGRRGADRRNGKAAKPGCGPQMVEAVDGVSGVPHTSLGMLAFILLGLIGLPAGGHLTVEAARQLAAQWGVSEAAIGLTVVALGTSLPELATTLVAAVRRHCGLALGNVLGSNLFNILAVIGIASVITPISVPERFLDLDLWVMLFTTLMIMPFVISRRTLTRLPAFGFLVAYVAYITLVMLPRQAAFAAGF